MTSVRLPYPVVRLFTCLLMALWLTPLSAQEAAKDDTPYSWTYQYTKGDSLRYRTTMDITGTLDTRPIAVTIKNLSKREVRSVNAKGEAVLLSTVEQYSVVFNGLLQPDVAENHIPILRTVSKSGRVLKQTARELKNDQFEALGLILEEMVAPEKPVRVGETWTTELNNRLVDGQKITLNSTLVGKEQVAGIETLKVKVQLAIPTRADAGPEDTIRLAGAYQVDPKAGRKLRYGFTLENVPLPNQVSANPPHVKIAVQSVQLIPGVNDRDEDSADKPQDKPAAAGK